MWCIPSRQRPHRLNKLIAACRVTQMSTPAAVLIDDDDPCLTAYLNLPIPEDWFVSVGEPDGLSGIYNRAFRAHPREAWYGVLCDDVVPETPEWDLKLIEAAGLDGMAVPAGGETTGGSPHFVLGGDLVRDYGWLALPGLSRLYIDTVWTDIADERSVYRAMPGVSLRHEHFSNGLALMDATYRKPLAAEDRKIYENWRCKRRVRPVNDGAILGN